MLYSILNPDCATTTGRIKADAHVFAGAVIIGAEGKTNVVIVLSWQAGIPLVVFAGIDPHAAINLYLAFMVQHPAVVVSKAFAAANEPYALNDPPGD